MFGNARLWVKNLGVRRFVSATDWTDFRPRHRAPEGLLAKHVEREPTGCATVHGRDPAVQLHYPYLVEDDGPQPFQPATTSKAPDVNGSFKNQYQNAFISRSARRGMIRALRATEAGSAR